jgi:hypothetical protein
MANSVVELLSLKTDDFYLQMVQLFPFSRFNGFPKSIKRFNAFALAIQEIRF